MPDSPLALFLIGGAIPTSIYVISLVVRRTWDHWFPVETSWKDMER